eukprot:SAG31_NODE_2225_length_6150_cov_2.229549_8_plen_202_part_00
MSFPPASALRTRHSSSSCAAKSGQDLETDIARNISVNSSQSAYLRLVKVVVVALDGHLTGRKEDAAEFSGEAAVNREVVPLQHIADARGKEHLPVEAGGGSAGWPGHWASPAASCGGGMDAHRNLSQGMLPKSCAGAAGAAAASAWSEASPVIIANGKARHGARARGCGGSVGSRPSDEAAVAAAVGCAPDYPPAPPRAAS